jgi:hypothetical protein
MGWMTAAAIVGSSLISADAAGDAAGAQAGASAASTAAQERMFNKQVELQEPWRAAGQGALNRLNYLLGLDSGAKSYDQYRAELLPQYTTTTPAAASTSPRISRVQSMISEAMPELAMLNRNIGPSTPTTTINEAALEAAIRARMAEDAAKPLGADYGKYARDFSMSDFEADPGYAFRLAEGQKALDRQAAARGGLISGAALKAAGRYGQEMGSQEYQNAFNRYQTNRANQLQPLQSLAGVGQTSANTLSNAAANFGAAVGANEINAGNARASGYVGGANAITQGLSQYLNYNQNQNMLNMLNQRQYGTTPQGYGTVLSDPYGSQG